MVDQPDVGIYPEYWEADVVLRDGGTAHLRPIRPQDADALQAFHAGQSQASIYMRFFSFKPKLSGKEVRRFTEVDHVNRVAFVITIGGEIMGVGRYDRLDDPTEAEVAFSISDAHQGAASARSSLNTGGCRPRKRHPPVYSRGPAGKPKDVDGIRRRRLRPQTPV